MNATHEVLVQAVARLNTLMRFERFDEVGPQAEVVRRLLEETHPETAEERGVVARARASLSASERFGLTHRARCMLGLALFLGSLAVGYLGYFQLGAWGLLWLPIWVLAGTWAAGALIGDRTESWRDAAREEHLWRTTNPKLWYFFWWSQSSGRSPAWAIFTSLGWNLATRSTRSSWAAITW